MEHLSFLYCPIRSGIEERGFDLSTQLMALGAELAQFAGHDSAAFLFTKAECVGVRAAIIEVRRQLEEHRVAHGC